MVFLKRLTVWFLEQLAEAFLLGCVLAAFVLRNDTTRPRLPTDVMSLLEVACIYGLLVAIVLFMHGYYVSKALFGVVFRSARPWLYPVIAAALFITATHIVFLRAKLDFTPESRAVEFGLALVGACSAFACAFGGGWLLRKWTRMGSAPTPYLSATVITLLAFILTNTAHCLRPVVGDFAFRSYGLPFTFYREGGYSDGWVWHSGRIVWRGLFGDIAVVSVAVVLLGTMWRWVNAHERMSGERSPIS